MVTYGTYRANGEAYGLIVRHNRREAEACVTKGNSIVSAYKMEIDTEYSYSTTMAKEIVKLLNRGIRACSSKNAIAKPFILGTMTSHEFTKSKITYQIGFYNNELCSAYITSDKVSIDLYYNPEVVIPNGIPYIQLSKISKEIKNLSGTDLSTIPVRTVEEIAIEKEDTSWLQNKKYFVVQDDVVAEQIFKVLDNYTGVIAYDVETTGLKINMFSKIGSKWAEELDKYNKEHPDEQIRVDRLCGIIFCVEDNISYYFPCFSRKYDVLYSDKNSPVRNSVVNNIKARYTIGDKRNDNGDEANYIRNTPSEELREDVILMERVRDILEKGYIETHGGSFEYKNGLVYDIDTNIKDDTMIMHQIMYKFRAENGAAEKSNLKFLSKKELGIDQWSLKDFFPSISENDSGKSKISNVKNKASLIDFSYMDLNGTKIYAPADGDCTFLLGKKYKQDLITNHTEQVYLYSFEMVVMLAIGYMEFYGLRINEDKINNTKDDTLARIAEIESEVRQSIGYASDKEIEVFNELKEQIKVKASLEEKLDNRQGATNEEVDKASRELIEITNRLKVEMNKDEDKIINLNSPKQVADLFYDIMEIPLKSEKKSVAKSALKPLMAEKNEDGTNKYPVVHLYSEYKKQTTLLTKFFDNLPSFMYPGGYIFSSFGQINTNTGRMSCSKPNAQQFPKNITKIVEARDGFVMCDADYSQIEYRTLTGMAGNRNLMTLFMDPDSDYHTLMASLMYDVPYETVTDSMRSAAKSFNFGIPYGMGFKSLAILLHGKSDTESVNDAKEKYEMYFKNQPETRQFFSDVKEAASVNKYTKTLWNRYRWYKFESSDGTTDNRKKAAALRQAGNAVIQGTAADIFKIGVARQFLYIRENKLFGKLLIVNMIHDEQLLEVDARYLNVMRVLRDIGINMQFHVDGMPPLYIGAGIDLSWGKAKSKEDEIHPELLEEISVEAEVIPIYKETPVMDIDTNVVVQYFHNRNFMFRRQKVLDYLTNPDNRGKNIHPAVGSLINSQFSGGRKKEDFDGDSNKFLLANLKAFIEENKLEVDPKWFIPNMHDDVEEEEGYDDDENNVEVIEDYDERNFTLIEDDKMYGADVVDIIKQFKVCVIKHRKICGIDTSGIRASTLDSICEYLGTKVCEADDEGSLQIIFLKSGNIMKRTGIYVNKLDTDELESIYRENRAKRAAQAGDIETRAVR